MWLPASGGPAHFKTVKSVASTVQIIFLSLFFKLKDTFGGYFLIVWLGFWPTDMLTPFLS